MIQHPTTRSRRLGLPGLAPTDRLAAGLSRDLDDAYHFFRGVTPGGPEPIDAVVVGPGGTWSITLADERGRFHRRNGHWYRWNRSTESWVPWHARQVTLARLAGHRLGLYLERAALPSTVEACLLLPSGSQITWEPGESVTLHVEPDAPRLATIVTRDDVLTPAQVDRIAVLLDPRQPLPRLAPSAPRG